MTRGTDTLSRPSKSSGTTISRPVYASKIIKAGALLDDTKTLLSHWDSAASVSENLDRIRRENVFGKASRSRVEDILAIFRQRYLAEADVYEGPGRAGEEAVPSGQPRPDPVLPCGPSRRLLHDAVTEILVPMQAQGIADITPWRFRRSLQSGSRRG